MENRHPRKLTQRNLRPGNFLRVKLSTPLILSALLTGCGAPGEPTPPSPPIPVAISDLAAQQSGDAVQLTFTLPAKAITGDRLTSPPQIEILRETLPASGLPDAKSFRVVDTVPGSLTLNYISGGQIRFDDPISPEETKAHPGELLGYLVRTRTSPKRASADSNLVSVRVFEVPEHISTVEARVTESAVELTWPASSRTSGGNPIKLAGYRVYRGELDPASADAASHDLAKAKWKSPLTLLGSPEAASYRDTTFDFGKTYLYLVRSILTAEDHPLESSDSNPAIVSPRDTFPPAAPQGLVAAAFPAAAQGAFHVDLSWSINLETDLAGYRVYRSEQEGTLGGIVTPELLPTPAYSDTYVVSGHRYWYTVTALDRVGNESAPSAPIAVDLSQP